MIWNLNVNITDTVDIRVDLTLETGMVFRLEETLGANAPYNTISNSALVRCYPGEYILV